MPVTQNISQGSESPSFGPSSFKSISAGCIVMKMPIKSSATSRMGPQVKWLVRRILSGVVRKERKAAARIITISITVGQASVTSPRKRIPFAVPSGFRNASSAGSVPLSTTAAMITRRNRRLWAPSSSSSVQRRVIFGRSPSAMSFLYW